MPQLKATKKDLRKNQRRRVVNNRWRFAVHEVIRSVREAVSNNDKQAATLALQKAQAILDRAARRNVIHRNKAARRKSTLAKEVARVK